MVLASAAVAHWLQMQSRASSTAAALNLAMTDVEVVASVGEPDRKGTWSGSNGAGKFYVYEFACLWDSAALLLFRDSHPKQVVVTFDDKELVREIGISGAYSKITRVVKASERK